MARTVLTALLIALVVGSAAEAKSPPLVDVGIGGGLVVDRGRYVFRQQAGRLLAVDDARGTVVGAPLPPGCDFGSSAVRFPWALVSCAEGPRVLNVGTGVANRPVGVPPPTELTRRCWSNVEYVRLGARWLAFSCFLDDPHGGRVSGFVNWRTGETVRATIVPEDSDLDGPTPEVAPRPDCRLRKPNAYQFNARLVLDQDYATRLIRVRPCGGGAFTTLSRCPKVCSPSTLGPAAVTWLEGPLTAKAYIIKTGRTLKWRLQSRRAASITSTGNAVWIRSDFRVYRAGL